MLLAALTATSPTLAQQAPQRLLIAYYYAWYDMDTWRSGTTADLPAQLYESSDPRVIQRHILQAQSAGIDAFNVAWLGPRNPTDRNLTLVLANAERLGFAASVGFETDSSFLRSRADFVEALSYAIRTHGGHPAYLRFEGKPVIFFWRLGAIPTDGLSSSIEAWREVRREVDPEGRTLWIGEGDQFQYLAVFDGIHPYSIAWAPNVAQVLAAYAGRTRQQAVALRDRKLWVATVMPGYDDRRTGRADAFARDRAGVGFYRETWAGAIASNPDMIIVTSWNEWVEGSQIEPSQTYGAQYLGETRALATRWKGPPREPPPDVLARIEADALFEACDVPGRIQGVPAARLPDGTFGEASLVWVQGAPAPIRPEPSERSAPIGAWATGTPLRTFAYLPGARNDGVPVTWRLVLDPDGQCGWVAVGLDPISLAEFGTGTLEPSPLPTWIAELIRDRLGQDPSSIEDALRAALRWIRPLEENPVIGFALVGLTIALLWRVARR